MEDGACSGGEENTGGFSWFWSRGQTVVDLTFDPDRRQVNNRKAPNTVPLAAADEQLQTGSAAGRASRHANRKQKEEAFTLLR